MSKKRKNEQYPFVPIEKKEFLPPDGQTISVKVGTWFYGSGTNIIKIKGKSTAIFFEGGKKVFTDEATIAELDRLGFKRV